MSHIIKCAECGEARRQERRDIIDRLTRQADALSNPGIDFYNQAADPKQKERWLRALIQELRET